MREGAAATTSLQSPGAFVETYERAQGRRDERPLLHLDPRISGVPSRRRSPRARDDPGPPFPRHRQLRRWAVRARHVRDAPGGRDGEQAAVEAERIATALDNVFVARSAPGGRVSADDEWTILRFAAGGPRLSRSMNRSTKRGGHGSGVFFAGDRAS